MFLISCNIVHIQSQYFYILSPKVNAIVLALCVCLCVSKQPKGPVVQTQNLEKSLPPASAVEVIESELCVCVSVSTLKAKPFDLQP